MSEPLHWTKRLRLQLSERGEEISLLRGELKVSEVQRTDAEAERDRFLALLKEIDDDIVRDDSGLRRVSEQTYAKLEELMSSVGHYG